MLSRVFTTREQWLLIGSAAAICVGGVTYYIAQPKGRAAVEVREIQIPVPQKIEVQAPEPAQEILPLVPTQAPAPARRISVSVSGAVANPGVYEFAEHDRVGDAIKSAGGAADYGDLTDINKAAELIDGSALVIPIAARQGVEDGKRLVIRSGQTAASLNPPEYTISGWRQASRTTSAVSTATATPRSSASTESGPLDLNTASAEQLETLPGIGPKLAGEIIRYREKQPFQSVDDLDNVPGIGEKRMADLRPLVRVGP